MNYIINPLTTDYGLGGSIGGLLGGVAGTFLGGPAGSAIGSKLGNFLGGQFDKKPQEEDLSKQRYMQSQYNAQANTAKVQGYQDSINNLVNPVSQEYALGGYVQGINGVTMPMEEHLKKLKEENEKNTLLSHDEYMAQRLSMMNNFLTQDYAGGGLMGEGSDAIVNSTHMNTFNEGGTHEQNPYGGIPQGIGSNGNLNTVEQDEVEVKLGKDEKYIFSNRLTYGY